MRLRGRGIKGDFWTDSKLAILPDAARLFYIGLWQASDDGGFFVWDPAELGAVLYPHQPVGRRQRNITRWGDLLEGSGRVERWPCGHGWIPTFEKHQSFVGGRRTFANRDAHQMHSDGPVRTRTDASNPPRGKDVTKTGRDVTTTAPTRGISNKPTNGGTTVGIDKDGREVPDPPARPKSEQVAEAKRQLERTDLHPAARKAFERIIAKYG